MPETELIITTKRLSHDIMLINIKGVLDLNTTLDLRTVLDDCFRQGIYRFIVDLAGLQHMGSTGVGVFISILDTLEEHKGGLVFISPNPRVRTTFNLFKLSNFFGITNNVKSALDELLMSNK